MKPFESTNATGYHELKRLQHLRLRVASITRVDWDTMLVDIKYMNESGGRTKVIMTSAYWSPQAFMGAMPEEGAAVIIGFYHTGADSWSPVILGYLPRDPRAARRIESTQVGLPSEGADDTAREGHSYVQRSRLRKFYPGQILLSSKDASDILLGDDVLLSNSLGNEILLRSDDQTIVQNSVSNVLNVPGGSIKFGPITRNDYVLDEHINRSGNPLVDSTDYDAALEAGLVDPITLGNGKKINYVCDTPANPNKGGNPFTELRTSVHEFNQVQMNLTEDTDHFAGGSFRAPLVEQVMGTLVGIDPTDLNTYGRILKPTLYTNITDPKGRFRLEEAGRSGYMSENESRTNAVAYYLRVGGYQKAITKTGNVMLTIPASTQAGPMGEGHSLEADLSGSAKISLGRERGKGTSLYLNTEGTVVAYLGKGTVDETGAKGRSLDITALSGVSVDVVGADEDGNSLVTILANKEYKYVGGDQTVEVKGNYNLTVHGVINEQILGQKIENYVGDRHLNVGGSLKETIIDSKQLMLGQGRTETIASGGDSPSADALTILAGNKSVTVTLGNLTETLAAGNYLETVTAGNKTISVVTGTYTVNVGTGAISISTASGAVSIATAAGAMSLVATGVVQITGGVINVTGGSVNLGPVVGGGVVTTAHPCLVTGAPHLGSLTVRASP